MGFSADALELLTLLLPIAPRLGAAEIANLKSDQLSLLPSAPRPFADTQGFLAIENIG
jgi:hypothetical protein